MGLFSSLMGEKKSSAGVAKERLQIILAHERSHSGHRPNYLPQLKEELMAVIAKYVRVDPRDIAVNLKRQDNLDVLEVKIELGNG